MLQVRVLSLVTLSLVFVSCYITGSYGQSSGFSSQLLQVKMGPFVNCSSMTELTQQRISLLIKVALVTEINARCYCGFEISKLTNGGFHCNADTPYYPTYRATIQSLENYHASDLVNFVSSWVSTDPSVSDGVGIFSVDSSCPVVTHDANDPACSEENSGGVDYVLLIGAMMTEFVILLIIFSIIIAIVVLYYSNRRAKRSRYGLKKRHSRKRLISNQSTQSTESHHSGVRMHSCEAYATSV